MAEENFEDYIDADKKIQADFCLGVHGASMINTNILDGDIVFIKNQSECR
ncbi:LexA family protein [Urinicoccus massiliensis]|nr:S24 family peptidase [Urinicoccus massiliensis]